MATILLVEDNPTLLQVGIEVLTDFGYTAVGTDATGALPAALTLTPDLILLDLHLDGVSGEDIFARIRDTEATHDIPILITSAVHNAAAIGRSLGADDVLKKPYGIYTLKAHIEAALARARPNTTEGGNPCP